MFLPKNLKWEKILFIAIGILLWIYIWLRAARVPLIYDEIATFFHYIHTDSFLPFRSHLDANNHLLNSALSWISYKILGSSPLALRLPNILSFPLFLFFVWKFARQIHLPMLRWIFILALLLTHNFLEFFALTRGYGLSMALMLGACWYLYALRFGPSPKYTILALVLGLLATAANLNLVHTFILLQILLMAWFLTAGTRLQKFQIPRSKFQTNSKIQIPGPRRFAPQDKPLPASRLPLPSPSSPRPSPPSLSPFSSLLSPLSSLFLGLLPTAFFIAYLLRLKTAGALYFGSSEGVFKTTFLSLYLLLFENGTLVFLYYAGAVFLAVLGIYLFINLSRKYRFGWLNPRFIFIFLLMGNIFAAWLAHLIFDMNYHEARTALYMYPLLIGAVLFGLDTFIYQTNKRWSVLLALPLLMIPVNFALNANLSHVSFENERIPESFYQTIQTHPQVNGYPSTIGGYRGREMQWAYLNFRNGGTAGIVQGSDYPGYIADYQIIDVKEFPEWRTIYDSINYDPQTHYYLLKHKIRPEPNHRATFRTEPMIKTTSEEFIKLGRGSASTLRGKALHAGYRLTLASPEEPLRAWIVFTVVDSNDKVLRYERIPLDWLRTSWNGEKDNLVNGMFIPWLPDSAHLFSTYLWNIEKKPVRIVEGQFDLFELQ
ncbi:MAG: hypothetical protein PHD61_10225 [Bacteroidales bacterium]|nr:hypothetical protein [Lentimicrobiaceae bacterium]MDD5695661.1 hypothetical protein [Bacteroidales bacterium]